MSAGSPLLALLGFLILPLIWSVPEALVTAGAGAAGHAGAGCSRLLSLGSHAAWLPPVLSSLRLLLPPHAPAELATTFPENSGYVAWVTAAFGPFWGFQVGATVGAARG